MEVQLLEPHPRRVLEAFRRGEFDGFEIIGRADEKDFFERCFREKILEQAAATMPSARKRHEVPPWFILAANLSLRLHHEHACLGFERVVRCGGLLPALDPAIASKHLDPESKRVLLHCAGFNDKNEYDRQTPCDQDTLRKFVRDVAPERWMDWFNGPLQELFQAHGFFDPEGVFIGDGSYLFVPDNPAYTGSVVLWFDEHNHPVDPAKLTVTERSRIRLRRCYKLVSLLHLRGSHFVYAGLRVVSGKTHELPVLYELVDQFVAQVGAGVLRKLILDRGFIDRDRIIHCRRDLGVEVLIPLKKNMDLWADAWGLAQGQPWQSWPLPPPVVRPEPPRPEAIRRREAKRQATLRQRRQDQPSGDPSERVVSRELCALKNFQWGGSSTPFHVVLVRTTYADGTQAGWALLTTEDFLDPRVPPEQYQERTLIEERHRQLKCFYDLADFHSRALSAVVAQVVFVLLSYTLRQWQLWKHEQTRLASQHPDQIDDQLNVEGQYVVIHHKNSYVQLPLVSFSRELLELGPEARAKALAKIRQLEQSFLSPMTHLRPPREAPD